MQFQMINIPSFRGVKFLCFILAFFANLAIQAQYSHSAMEDDSSTPSLPIHLSPQAARQAEFARRAAAIKQGNDNVNAAIQQGAENIRNVLQSQWDQQAERDRQQREQDRADREQARLDRQQQQFEQQQDALGKAIVQQNDQIQNTVTPVSQVPDYYLTPTSVSHRQSVSIPAYHPVPEPNFMDDASMSSSGGNSTFDNIKRSVTDTYNGAKQWMDDKIQGAGDRYDQFNADLYSDDNPHTTGSTAGQATGVVTGESQKQLDKKLDNFVGDTEGN